MEFLGLKVPSLLDSGHMVTLICEAYFNKHILPLLCMVQWKNLLKHIRCFTSQLLIIKEMPVLKYFEADISILGFRIPSVGFLVVKDPNTVLESHYSTHTSGVIGCNLIWLGYEEFRKVFGFEAFKTFTCLKEVHPLIFAQMCTLYHQGKNQAQSDLIHSIVHLVMFNKPVQSKLQIPILIFIQLQKTLVLRMQLSDKCGLATHARSFASQPTQ